MNQTLSNIYLGANQAKRKRYLLLAALLASPAITLILSSRVLAATWVNVPVQNDPLLQNLSIPANAPTQGMWSAAQPWPFIGLHSTVLPNGKVLTWGTNPDGSSQNGRYFDVWDPSLGLSSASHQTTYNATRQDSFCAAATFLSDGRLMVTGGNGSVTSSLISTSTGSITKDPANLANARWYTTIVNLPDGRPIALGGMMPYTEGMYNNPDQSVAQGLASMTPEVYENGAWRSLFGANSREAFGPDNLRASLPRAWVAPNGKVFGLTTDKMWYVDPAGNGTTTITGNFKTPPNATTRPNTGPINSAVMYAPGKILVMGGNGLHNGFGLQTSNKATVIDINSGGTVLSEQLPMNFPRSFPNPIVLPNGKVLVTGGETVANNNPTNGVFAAEQWDPATGQWAVLSSASVYRGYHSATSLLPNGTVISTGGGNPGPAQLKGEIYYPPYLFRTINGVAQLAPRPVIKAISSLSFANGATMQMDMADNGTISQLVLIGLSSGTHSFNSGQRRIPLAFSQDSIRLTTTIPNNTTAPPGYYQVIALDANGVPSLGTIVAIGQGQTPPPVNTTPYTPPDLSGTINAPVIAAGATASYTLGATVGATYSWNFGDGSPATDFTGNPAITHMFASPGVYGVTLTARAADGSISTRTFLQAVATGKTALNPNSSTPITVENRNGGSARAWSVNPDNNSVSVIDTLTNTKVAEINVGTSPRSVAIAPDNRIWVTNKASATISIISPSTLAITQTINLPRASQPHGLAFAPTGNSAYVVLEASGQLLKLDATTGAQQSSLVIGQNTRHLAITADGVAVLISRFITPTLPGESTATVDTSTAGAEVLAINADAMTITKTITLRHSDKVDNEIQGSGIPNYLGAPVISPDGQNAWIPSKQDNIKRGTLRNGQPLNFQNSVRAISSQIDMVALAENYTKRVDLDNSGLGSAALHHPSGAYLFVALETSRQVAVVDAIGGRELFRIEVGKAPQGLAISADGKTLYVHEFMDRNVRAVDLNPLLNNGLLQTNILAVVGSVGQEKLSAQVLQGKQFFYDARDTRLARDGYLSCASCHNDGGHDGRVWDFTGFGEGLRNTISLNGRAGIGHGFLHWTANFNEVQDFEAQIRNFAGGLGLMSDVQFNTGTRNQSLGDKKAGVNTDLDALAAYLTSLNNFSNSPFRAADASLTPAAALGKTVFQNANCTTCHTGANFTVSSNASASKNIGTIKPTSGTRLGATLTGIDVPTLRDAWSSAPYLHDGSAATLAAAVQAHQGNAVAGTDLNNLVAYIQQIGAEEPGFNLAISAAGTGLQSVYYATNNLTGTAVLQRVEAVNFNWGTGSPGTGVPTNNFSARWTGYVEATTTGNYQFQTNSDDGVRVWINGQLVINNWTVHSPTVNTSANIALTAGQRVTIKIEYQEFTGGAVMQLRWLTPGATAFSAIPAKQLYTQIDVVGSPPANSVICANENQTCALPAGVSATLWYGANSSWTAKTGLSGNIACNNTTFGDPLPGTVKACRYL